MVLELAKKARMSHQADLADDQVYVSRLEKKILLRGQNEPENRLRESHVDFREPVPIDMRKKSKKRGPLTVSEKIDVVHKALV